MPSIYRQAAAIVCVAFLACTADARPKPASEHTRGIQAEALGNLPDKLEREIRFASQGFIATRPDGRISQADGSLSADLTNMSFLQGDAPATVHPALWQHSALTARHGLFKVNDGIYQVRGFDVSNITFISSDNGWIVVDPLTVNESSAAALSLLREHVDQRPIKAVIYTHPHTDHFAGVGGIIEATQVVSGEVEVIAPEGFMHELVQEWIIAGNAMGRRGFYQFGLDLPAGEHANVGIGMGPFVPFGEQTLIPPTTLVSQPVQTLMIDGLEVVFLLTPGAEAPVEFNFYIPRYKALCTAETATSSLHNVLTLRGAAVRDAKAWADSLTATADLFPEAELVFMTHHWPRFGNEEVMEFLGKQRDTYKYLHDQSVRLMNLGYGPAEIAERIKLPSTLAQEWYNRGFYGSLSHNAKAVYQKYMGWYSGVPADLNPHTPVERAHRYIAAMGGRDRVRTLAQRAYDMGDYRWAAEIGNHLVFDQAMDKAGRELLASTYEQLGYQAESAIWRNIYLSGALELRNGVKPFQGTKRDMLLPAASTADLLDLAATRLVPDRADGKSLAFNLEVTDRDERLQINVHNNVLVHRENYSDATLPTIRTSLKGLLAMLLAGMSGEQAVDHQLMSADQDLSQLEQLAALLEQPKLEFNIIEP